MSKQNMVAVDGNEATAAIAHKVSEVVAIYPITPSSPMAEFSDAWSAQGKKNIWGQVPKVIEMQSEGGAAGTVHGSLQAGALTTTFTASQGLLLMIPNMYKIAGELTSAVFHVTARALAAQGLSIFGDHSDVMGVRQTGWSMLASSGVQEAHDLALVAHAATLESRVPMLHFFDGFRTSHEVMKISPISDEVIAAMISDELVAAHRARALNPDKPVIRGTAQNPDVYFQGRETVNPYVAAAPAIVQKCMDKLAALVGRKYNLVDYSGAPDAERVVVVMGSAAQTVGEVVQYLVSKGEKVGMLNMRLFRPFPAEAILNALPATVKSVAVLDRTKEPGSAGEPLFQDVLTTLSEAAMQGRSLPRVVSGRYGLGSKEFTPAQAKAVFDELAKSSPKKRFVVGIVDDVSGNYLQVDPAFRLPSRHVTCLFYGLGADGTVGANKNSIKIIAEATDNWTQGYFVYDSKKSGSMTTSHLRFGKDPITKPYLIDEADFIACHHTPHLDQIDMLRFAKPGAVFLFNTHFSESEVWETFPAIVQKHIIDKKLQVFVIDGYKVGKDSGMGRRINTIMQTCFFAIAGVLPREEAIDHIKKAIKKTYQNKGDTILNMNMDAVDMTLSNLHQVKIPAQVSSTKVLRQSISPHAPAFVQEVTTEIMFGRGDQLPVSKMPVDGTFPVGTTQWEKRDLALEIPVWIPELCTQCGNCSLVCPHAAIRSKLYPTAELAKAPAGFKSTAAKGVKMAGNPLYTIQVSPFDCTGCGVCVEDCPAIDKANPERRAINMELQAPVAEQESSWWDYFIQIPDAERGVVNVKTVKGSQLLQPLFEFSGACSGCGETAYIKLVSQLFGDRMIVANATGCSSIYGGNLPTTPWRANAAGRGPAWANSLFEDNAEFGLGMRLAVEKHREQALLLLEELKSQLDESLVTAITTCNQQEESGIFTQRTNIEALKAALAKLSGTKARTLEKLADYLAKKSVWIVGGDGWAYDIGYGGLDHVLATGQNVNILVLDTEVYSNTGGQASKATNRGAVAQFAAAGKAGAKKDLGLIAMAYRNVYVGRIALGANHNQAIKTLLEAEAYDGPSLVLAYSPCIAHGYDMKDSLEHQKLAVNSGYWPLLRFSPMLADQGKSPLQLDCKAPSIPVKEYIYKENRYRQLLKSDPITAEALAQGLQYDVDSRWSYYEKLAKTGEVPQPAGIST